MFLVWNVIVSFFTGTLLIIAMVALTVSDLLSTDNFSGFNFETDRAT